MVSGRLAGFGPADGVCAKEICDAAAQSVSESVAIPMIRFFIRANSWAHGCGSSSACEKLSRIERHSLGATAPVYLRDAREAAIRVTRPPGRRPRTRTVPASKTSEIRWRKSRLIELKDSGFRVSIQEHRPVRLSPQAGPEKNRLEHGEVIIERNETAKQRQRDKPEQSVVCA